MKSVRTSVHCNAAVKIRKNNNTYTISRYNNIQNLRRCNLYIVYIAPPCLCKYNMANTVHPYCNIDNGISPKLWISLYL